MSAAQMLNLRVKPFVAARSAGAQRRNVTCRMGGFNFGGNDQGGQPNRLFIPGSDSGAQNRPGNLIVPGQGGQGRPLAPGMGSEMPPATTNFRPPPGFMDAVGRPQEQDLGISPDEMLGRLRTNAGAWHELAKFLPALQRAGYDSVVVEEMVGLERRLQNVWTAAEQVYESVKKSGELSPYALAYFDGEGGEMLLYELRFLSIRQRSQAAQYIADNELSAQESQVLARAVKDHERRVGTKEGFGGEPGDCLAYKYYRDAIECRKKEDAEVCVQKGLSVVVSDTARAKLASLLGEQEQAAAARPAAQLTTLRMTKDELGFRVVCVAGALEQPTATDVMGAPKVSSGGIFGNFHVPGGDHEWVALPNWSLLQLAGHPVAVDIPNCADVPQIRAASYATTEDELKRLSGSGLLVVDLLPEDSTVREDAYYLATDAGGVLHLQDGSAVGSLRVLGPVLFLCRPPARDGGMAGSTAELLSL